jgi:hypothetical protein
MLFENLKRSQALKCNKIAQTLTASNSFNSVSGLFADLFDRAFEDFLAKNGKVNCLSYLSKNLGEASEDGLFMQFIPIEL